MDEEKQKAGMLEKVWNKTSNKAKKGAKDFAKNLVKKIVKTIIKVIVPYIVKAIAIALIVSVIITALTNLINWIVGDEAEEANAFAVKYSTSSPKGSSGNSDGTESNTEGSSLNSIIVDIKNATENGAYELDYEFRDKDGNLYNDTEALDNIKRDLVDKNEKLDLTKFSDSELKIIGTLMYNGLMVESYDEEELKAIALFTKADIASQSFDLRSGEDTDIDIESLRKNDEVYGTLEIHKTKIEANGEGDVQYKPIKMEYVPYGDESTRRNILFYGCTKR